MGSVSGLSATKPRNTIFPDSCVPWIKAIARVVALSILLGITLLLQSPGQTPIVPPARYLGYFIAAVYCYTILSAFVLQELKRGYNIFAAIQILSDIFFTSLLVIFSGGSQSIFILVFFFPIICSSLLNQPLYRLLLTTATALAYGCILLLELHGYPPALFGEISAEQLLQSPFVALYRFVIPGLTFFLVGFLSSVLAERLRKTEAALSVTSQSLDRLSVLYKQIFDDINTGIITVDQHGLITSFNRAAEEITAYKSLEIIGHKLDREFPGLSFPQTQNWRPTFDLTRRDGVNIPIGYSWAKLNLPEEEGDSLVFTFQDLSQIKKMENQVRQAEKMAGIGHMAAGIAHEFRNPLAAISGAAQMLSQQLESDNNRRLMGIILRESDRMERNITEFLQFSRPAQPERKWFSLYRLVEESIALLHQANDCFKQCEFKLDIPLLMDCWGDADQLRQVLDNLLCNSCQAMNPHGGLISISAREEDNGKNEAFLILTVMDQGKGVDEKIINKIFEPFFTTRDDGTGLGLAIVWQIVDNHNGRIAVQNAKPQGAEFVLTLPLP
ncbi:MAG: ATP-binding protein [Deltaproteobacteria bacterium]